MLSARNDGVPSPGSCNDPTRGTHRWPPRAFPARRTWLEGGPGFTRSDLLVINKTDLAPIVGASLEVMERDARKVRGDRPFVFSNMKSGEGVDAVQAFVKREGLLEA